MARFKQGDRVKKLSQVGTVVKEDDGGFVVHFDGEDVSRFVFSSDLTPAPSLDDRLWRLDPCVLESTTVELPSKDQYSTGQEPLLEDGTALMHEKLRYHAAFLAMCDFRTQRDQLLDVLRAVAQWMDYEPDSDFGCGNDCPGCQTEMIEASRIVQEALAKHSS